MNGPRHEVLRLWIRAEPKAPVEERPTLTVETGKGVVGDHTFGRLRHVTIVFADDWNAAARTLGRDVDPAGRRANVLVSGGNGARYLKHVIRIGDIELEIKGETAPCPLMNEAAEGMQDALRPDGRGGIWGRALAGGTLRRGDVLTAVSRVAEKRR